MLDLRSDFPVLARKIDDQSIVYLDSAATTLKPQVVIDAENYYNTYITANIHRGKHTLSEESSQEYEDARSEVAKFVNTQSANIVFVKNATEALNTIANGLELSKRDKILIPVSEHHSNIVPWMRSSKVVFLDSDPTVAIDPQLFDAAMNEHRPRVVSFTAASNVTGVINPIKELSRIARKYNAISVVDASQYVAHFLTNVDDIDCDYLVFSGHKMLGPTGIGVLYGKPERLKELSPLCVGGGCIERVSINGFTLKAPPYCFEAGTPPIAAALGLAAAIKYIRQVGFERIQAHEKQLAAKLNHVLQRLQAKEKVYLTSSSEIALASFSLPEFPLPPDSVSASLSENYKIMTRSGHHCAHPFFDSIGLQSGSVRVSAYIYNTLDEIEYFDEALESIVRRFSMAA